MRIDLHSHTVYSDGRNTAEEMVQAAIGKRLDLYGISDHSYTSFEKDYCMDIKAYEKYKAEIKDLKEKYRNEIDLSCGIEYDYYSDYVPEGFDYVIGSVHCLKIGENYLSVDMDRETFEMIGRDYFNDDYYSFCEAYYETLSDICDKTKIDIVGHFDLITKFNEGNKYFDENDERYINAWQKAMLKLLKDVKCFEINYGAVNKGIRSVPYLSRQMQEFLIDHGGYTIRSSDSHNIENVGRFGK